MPNSHRILRSLAVYLCVAVLVLATFVAHGSRISLVGSWSQPIGSSLLTGGPGTGIRSPIESDPVQATISISDTDQAAWCVKVRQVSADMPTDVLLAVKRTTDGVGQGSILGGQNYLVIGETEQILFEGIGDRSEIGLQYKLEGVTILQGQGRHGSTLLYRVE
ncbi:MAG: hypothetical protein KFB96_11830 [Thiocapsa sp.]|uniref:hypothetical protein n=1 Tax=Thiocapsa sp. TaxID=2024551 RepID=UPI001BCCCB95|nr:hypothetical protein [Thiocapsa sp.]QVL51028.1 MAG: hypothetical protein KFB96_11830 [Thiocapsa sp.]